MTRSRHPRVPSFLASLWAVLLLVACASTTKEPIRAELLVTLHNYRGGERFELANEAHTNRVNYYSSARNDAARKVQTDEVMSAFLRELQRLGFEEHARVGRAPDAAQGDVVRWGLEVASGEREVHWLVGTGSALDEWKAFEQCRDTFLQLYNSTVSYQTVQNESGKEFFDDRARAASAREQQR
jgi:hypothetical protein